MKRSGHEYLCDDALFGRTSGPPRRRWSGPRPEIDTLWPGAPPAQRALAVVGEKMRKPPRGESHVRSLHKSQPGRGGRRGARETGSATAGRRGSRARRWPRSTPASRSFASSPASAARSPIATPTPRRSTSFSGEAAASSSTTSSLTSVRLDSIRVAPATARAFEAGQDGLEFLAFGPHHPGDGEPVEDPWTE